MHFISVVTTIFVVLQAGVSNVIHIPPSRCRSRVSYIYSSYKIVGISLARKVTIIQIHNSLRPRQKVPPIPLIFFMSK